MNYQFEIKNIQETKQLGLLLGACCVAGDIICLSGDLGAGKTTLTQYIALGLDVSEKDYVTSPSFAIMHEYQGRLNLYHMDLYRLGGEDEVIDLGFEDLFYGVGLCVIEWPKRAEELIPSSALWINIEIKNDIRFFCVTCAEDNHWNEDLRKFREII